MNTKRQQYETVARLKELTPLKKEYDRLRKEIDEMTGKHTTVFDYYGKTLVVGYDDTTTVKVDYKGLLEELGATPELIEKYTTRTATTRFKAVM